LGQFGAMKQLTYLCAFVHAGVWLTPRDSNCSKRLRERTLVIFVRVGSYVNIGTMDPFGVSGRGPVHPGPAREEEEEPEGLDRGQD
jgi:hypothetical protein